jgi:diacylglycerol O-acyltransferase / wax synthase
VRNGHTGNGGARPDDLLTAYRAVRETDLPLHVGGLCILDGPVDVAALERVVVDRASRMPRLAIPLDPSRRPPHEPRRDRAMHGEVVRLERESAQPPGGDAELSAALAEIWSRRLARHGAPLGITIVEGLARGRTAVVVKAHRSVVDDRGCLELVERLLGDEEPGTHEQRAARRTAVRRSERLPATSIVGGLWSISRPLLAGTRVVSRAVADFAGPGGALDRARDAARWLESTSLILSTPAPETPINGALGSTRSLGIARFARDVLRGAAEAFDATCEQVVLTIVADALGRYLKTRGRVTTALELLALATPGLSPGGTDDGRGALVALPVGALATRARLASVRAGLADPSSRTRRASLETVVGFGLALPGPARQVTATLAYQAVNTVCVQARSLRRLTSIAGRKLLLVAAIPALPWTIGLGFAWTEVGDDETVVGVAADSGLVPDLDPVLAALRAAYVEVAASAGVPAIDPERRARFAEPG